MLLAAQQPSYLPDIAFFSMMKCADVFVIVDDVRYSTHSNLNRTRIKSADGAQWLTVPVSTKGKLGQFVKDVHIDPQHTWRHQHWRTLTVSYSVSPFFEEFEEELYNIYQKNWTDLFDLNVQLIKLLKNMLGITTPVYFTSEHAPAENRDEKVHQLLTKFNCAGYLISAREKKLMDEEKLINYQKSLLVHEFAHPVYHQRFGEFQAGLSIIDLLMNEGYETSYIIEKASF